VALAGVDETPYALVAAEVAEELPVFTKDVGATTRPFEAGEAALGLVRYDRRGWRAVAACPAVVPGDAGDLLGPRLGYHAGRLLVAWVPEQGDQIITLWYALDEGRWETGSTISVPGLDAFWVPLVNRLPTIVARRETGAGVAGLRVFGFVPRDAREGERWKNVEAEFSPIALADPDGLAAEDPALSGLPVTRAFGFNQHLGVLQVEVLAAPEAVQGEPLPAPDAREPAALLRFARLGGEPAMKTVDVFADPPARPSPEPIQTLRLVVVLSILIMLFVFRRGALATPAPLPADYAPALFTQRLGALLVDLLPFALVATAFTPVRWDEVGGELFAWAFDAQLNETGLPRPELMYWWLITIGMYALYCLIMEAISARTVGKVLTRVRVVTTDGRRAVLWQVVGRNVFKVVELLPPFWIFAFVMVLSRNRQRIGDIFAYTLVVRQREATAERPPQDKPPPGPPES
jgi:uncharacterized RDD family membrane protein YckC